MNKLLLYIFSYTKIGKMLDGKKTLIGAMFVILSAALQMFQELAPMFPDVPWFVQAAQQTSGIISMLSKTLDEIGLGFLAVGVLHKSAKAAEKK